MFSFSSKPGLIFRFRLFQKPRFYVLISVSILPTMILCIIYLLLVVKNVCQHEWDNYDTEPIHTSDKAFECSTVQQCAEKDIN